MQGVSVFSDKVNTKSTQFEMNYDISDFTPGLYYLRFIRGQEVRTKPLVVIGNQ